MPGGSFFDSNILIYLAGEDERKADRAEQVMAQTGTVSVQVLNEFANVARSRLRWDWHDIRQFLDDLLVPLEVLPLTRATHELGLRLAGRHRLHVYDAMILAAALEAGCDVLYSEDMHDGALIGRKLRIVNPFLDL